LSFTDQTPMSADQSQAPIDLAREPRFRIGAVEVSPSTRELVAAGRRETLQPRVMQVLVALARRWGEVVSRDELIAMCWGGRVVGEDAINRCIFSVRQVGNTYGAFSVETILRVGYRLGGVETLTAAPTFPQANSGPTAHWAAIKNSLDPADYGDFLEVFPQAEQAFEARRQKRRLEAWAATDQTDPVAVSAFLKANSFAALQTIVQTTGDNLAKARLLSIPQPSRPGAARRAALDAQSVPARRFGIYLRGEAAGAWRPPTMVAIPPGRFMMGSSAVEARWTGYHGEEEPKHEVAIDYVFALGQSAVTLDAFAAFIAATRHDMSGHVAILSGGKYAMVEDRSWRDPGFPQTGDHPVTCVNWHDAQAFLAWLNDHLKLAGRPDAYRLPSEAEWEYACRAGTQTRFNFGALFTIDQANICGRGTTPTGQFPANAFGLYDMHGNVWEWCDDNWHPNYQGAPTDGSAWADGRNRVFRGSSWDSVQPFSAATRLQADPSVRHCGCGFRLARTLLPTETWALLARTGKG
jgi:formylglycine-generating enzyme required for sulfatase activity/DNA-binding winged helix-turn-helix (wHTH) protein